MRRYTYNPNAENLEFNTDANALAVIDGCIAFSGMGAIYDRGRYIPDSENVILNTTEQVSDSVVTNPTLNVTGSGIGALYVLSGSTTEEENSIANRTIIANQITNGLAKVVGQTISDENGSFYMGLDTTNNNPVLATAYQDFGKVWQAEANLNINDVIRPAVANGFVYKAKTAGKTSAVEPSWPTINATEFTDGTVTFIADVYYQPVSHAPVELQTNALIEFSPTIEQHDSCPIPIIDYIDGNGVVVEWGNSEPELFSAIALNAEDAGNVYSAYEHSRGYRNDGAVTANAGLIFIYRDILISNISSAATVFNSRAIELNWMQMSSPNAMDEGRGVIVFYDIDDIELTRFSGVFSYESTHVTKTLVGNLPVDTAKIRVGFEAVEMGGDTNVYVYFKDINLAVLPYDPI